MTKKNNVIEYQFRGKLDVDLLAENMKHDKTPFAIVIGKFREQDTTLFITKKFKKHYKGKDLELMSSFYFFDVYNDSLGCNLPNSSSLTAWTFNKGLIPKVISNIKAIIKSHEDASLPVVKVLAVETTADIGDSW